MLKKNWKRVLIVLLILMIISTVIVYADNEISSSNVTYELSNGNTIMVDTALDDLYTKVGSNAPLFTQGQLVKINNDPVATDRYYVLYEGNDTVELFAKTNLNLAATQQANADNSTTACAFSSSQYWGNNTGLNLNLEPGYSATDAIGKARSYAKSKGAIEGRLLTLQEVKNLTGISGDTDSWSSMTNTKIKAMLNGEGNTAQNYEEYWLGLDGSSYTDDVLECLRWKLACDY